MAASRKKYKTGPLYTLPLKFRTQIWRKDHWLVVELQRKKKVVPRHTGIMPNDKAES